MPDKDQVQGQKAGEQSKEKPESFSDRFDRGWDQVELLTKQESEAKAQKPAATEPIQDGDKSNSDKVPFKVLKVQGKDVPVYSEEELIELAQKGSDYTKKTQTLAEEKRAAEAALKEEEKKLADAATDLNKTLDQMMKLKEERKSVDSPDVPKDNTEIPPVEASIYADYGIDPKYAQPHEIKIVKDLAEVKAQMRSIQQERATAEINKIIAKERETYPYEDVVDDQGQNITESQIASIVTAKRTAAERAKENLDPAKWLKEAVREVHIAQQKTRESLSVSDGMDPDSFVLKYPDLAAKLKAKFGAVEQQASQQKSIIPPALPATKRDGVPTTMKKKAVAPGGKSLNDWLDEGFNDPETIKALTGG